MANLFAENEYTIWTQKRDLAGLRDRAAHLRADDMDALALVSEKFKPHDRPEEVIAYIMGEGSEEEAAFQLQITANALEKVSGVLRVLTAQKFLHPYIAGPQKKDIVHCLHSDEAQLSLMFFKASQSVRQLGNSEPVQNGRFYANMDAEMELVIKPLFDNIAEDVDGYMNNIYDPRFYAMGEGELIEQVGELRLESVKHNLEANDLHLQKVKKTLDQVTYVEKARDENIIPSSRGVQEFIDDKLDYADKAMQRTDERLAAAQAYLKEIFNMDELGAMPEAFKARHYVAAPLINLFDNTP